MKNLLQTIFKSIKSINNNHKINKNYWKDTKMKCCYKESLEHRVNINQMDTNQRKKNNNMKKNNP